MARKGAVNNENGGRHPREGGIPRMNNINSLVASGIQTINELADTCSKVSTSVDRRKTVETDNAVKISKADTDARKEENRHREQMAKLEQERLKLSDSAADKEANRTILREMIKAFRDQYEYYLALSQDAFLSELTASRLDKLNDIISALAMELIRVV